MSEIRGNGSAEVHELIGKRWSPRAFDATRAVEREKLLSCLEAARWAPSCFGDEPWRYVVCDRFEDEDAWRSLLSCLSEKNQLWAQHVAVLMVSCADSEFRQNGNPNRWGQHDTGAASVSICLQATALGLASHQMGGFDVDAVRRAFDVPGKFMPMSVIAIGYTGNIQTLHDDFMSLETGERQRRPLSECFFTGKWSRGVNT